MTPHREVCSAGKSPANSVVAEVVTGLNFTAFAINRAGSTAQRPKLYLVKCGRRSHVPGWAERRGRACQDDLIQCAKLRQGASPVHAFR